LRINEGYATIRAMSLHHPTAIIGKNVEIGAETEIGPYAVIENGVRIGNHNKILARAFIAQGTEMGNHNEIHMGAIIGNTPQDRAFTGVPTQTKIGNHNIIREYVTIHRGTKENTATTLGNDNFIMAYAHIAHNCQIKNRVTLVNGASLAGYCVVDDDAFLSGMTVFHQFIRIGRLAIVSAFSAVNLDVPPFMMCGGRGAVVHGPNVVGLRRAGFTSAVRDDIKRAFKIIYRSDLNRSNAVSEIEKNCSSKEAHELAAFVKASKRGVCMGENSRESASVRF
jgi:UDP-N-acetylglucosamine acyltransferase